MIEFLLITLSKGLFVYYLFGTITLVLLTPRLNNRARGGSRGTSNNCV